jgi:hypothetical protein
MDCSPPGAVAVSDLLDKFPIDLWRERMPEQAAFIGALVAFQSAYAQFVSAVSHVEGVLDGRIRTAIYEYENRHSMAEYEDVDRIRKVYIFFLRGEVERKAEHIEIIPGVVSPVDGHDIIFKEFVNIQVTFQAMNNLLAAARTCRERLNTITGLLN